MTTDRPTLTALPVPPEAARAFAIAWADLVGTPAPAPVDGTVWAWLYPVQTRRLRAVIVGTVRDNLLDSNKENAR
jgi:hypothetical protein